MADALGMLWIPAPWKMLDGDCDLWASTQPCSEWLVQRLHGRFQYFWLQKSCSQVFAAPTHGPSWLSSGCNVWLSVALDQAMLQ